jgi:hypothetical protein
MRGAYRDVKRKTFTSGLAQERSHRTQRKLWFDCVEELLVVAACGYLKRGMVPPRRYVLVKTALAARDVDARR